VNFLSARGESEGGMKLKSLMQEAFLAAFEEQIVELQGGLPRLKGRSRRDALAELES